ncbi:FAD-binding oxidoreductase [Aliishimia ponticola]|uniref:FAD-binding oxidoreductase n=1 Tax=Aliishimia ponticola TaxID=2499833 RepID=A0A4S4NFL8_9RHOB|nr:FAD-binding oxidoreductase [Aliishimia ponticola]THH36938.1 FAD-binding oxidoreductase [Aliishimia ponticola]
MAVFPTTPARTSYDVVIVGGAIMGSSTAWWLKELGFDGSILVVERDPSYTACSTAHTNSCIRQQFSSELNIRISQFGAQFVKNLRDYMKDDKVPELGIQNYGYLYLADNAQFADTLRANQAVQRACGAETELLTPDEIAERYPFYDLDGIVLGSINRKDEGYWDGGIVFEWFRRLARERGVEYVQGEVTGMTRQGGRITDVTLASGDTVSCGKVVNASGPRAAVTAKMAGLDVPVEPRKRFTWIFSAEKPLDRDLPLTIDPSGVHFRQDGPKTYLAGCPADPDPAVDPTDFAMDHNRWQDHVWPTIATRIPQFDALKIVTEWAGHYAYNTLDQNAVLGPHPEVENFLFLNGFSGHGLQQSPAMGRAMAEWLIHGAFQTLDLSPFAYDRIIRNEPYLEKAVI